MATCRFLPHISYVRLSFYKYSNDNKIQQLTSPVSFKIERNKRLLAKKNLVLRNCIPKIKY